MKLANTFVLNQIGRQNILDTVIISWAQQSKVKTRVKPYG